MFFDKPQVLYHTHMVKSTVLLIECLQSLAWEITALVAEAYQPFTYQVALIAHIDAVFTARPAACTIRLVESLLFQVVLHCQVISAYTAIHPAGGYKVLIHTL